MEHPRHAAIHNQSPLVVSQHGYSAANSDKGLGLFISVDMKIMYPNPDLDGYLDMRIPGYR